MTTEEIAITFNKKTHFFRKDDNGTLLLWVMEDLNELCFDTDFLIDEFQNLIINNPEKMLYYFANYLIYIFGNNITNREYTLSYYRQELTSLIVKL